MPRLTQDQTRPDQYKNFNTCLTEQLYASRPSPTFSLPTAAAQHPEIVPVRQPQDKTRQYKTRQNKNKQRNKYSTPLPWHELAYFTMLSYNQTASSLATTSYTRCTRLVTQHPQQVLWVKGDSEEHSRQAQRLSSHAYGLDLA